MRLQNSRQWPKVYYGLHMAEGVAEYADDPAKEPYRILINENTLKSMDPTYAGKPVYVQHVAEVDLDNIQEEADGYVMESFYNKADGKHWVKFIVVSDDGHAAIRKGWQLSNSYVPQSLIDGGQWHGVQYAKEITSGEYEHLAIVENPRYEESVIMTPEDFKRYNEEKEAEIKRLTNSKEKEKGKMGLQIFKRAKVDNAADLAGMSVLLPKSGKEMTIEELVTEHDKILNMRGYASSDHMVKVGEEEMSVKNLVKKHMDMCNEAAEAKKNAEAEAEESEEDAKDAEGADEHKENDDDEDADDKKKKKENDEDEEAEAKKKKNEAELADKKAKAKAKADRLRNANDKPEEEVAKVILNEDKVARGRSLFGSN